MSATICLGLVAAEFSKDQNVQAASRQQSVVAQQNDQLALTRRRLADKWGAVHATKSDHEQMRFGREDEAAEYATADFQDETELVDGTAVRPVLMRDRRTRKLVVGNFTTRSFEGDQGMCFELSRKMAEDVGAPEESIEVLADTDSLTMLRFCAVNGSIVMNCRNGQVTISPRRSRPDDGCSVTGGVSLAGR